MTTIDQHDHRISPRDPRKAAHLLAEDEIKHKEKLALSEKAWARYADFKERREFWMQVGRDLDAALLDYRAHPEIFAVFIGRRQSYGLTRILEPELDERVKQLESGKADPMWWTQFHEDVNARKDWREKFDPAYQDKKWERDAPKREAEYEAARLERQAQLEAEAAEKALELRLFDDILGGAA